MKINSELFTDVAKETQETISGGATVVNFDTSKLPKDFVKNLFTGLTFGFHINLSPDEEKAVTNAFTTAISSFSLGTPT